MKTEEAILKIREALADHAADPINSHLSSIEVSPDSLRALLARMEEVEKDAQRYRMVRQSVFGDATYLRIEIGRKGLYDGTFGGELDSTLDAAISSSKGGATQ